MTNIKLIEDLGIIKLNPKNKEARRCGLYSCSCGNTFRAISRDVNSGNTKSCGCLKLRKLKENIKHGECRTKLYYVWQEMKKRCLNVKHKQYPDYGGRGIMVCKEWQDSFILFKEWSLDNGYTHGLQIDRINNNLGYSSDNCRFTTPSIQSQNTRLLRKNNTSGYRGVSKKGNSWVSCIHVDRKKVNLGTYNTKLEGAMAYNKYVIRNNLSHPLNIV